MIDAVQIPGYSVLRTLGAGGMATVYLAVQESLEREVALKVMAPVLAANADFCEQFLKEGRITAKLSHPHLVTVHDIGSYRGTYYMASEYLSAGSLRERLQTGLGVYEAINIAHDLASGLTYAHEMGFVHRDVKPGNILFRSSGAAVLADFGIAKAIKSISSATMAGTAIGTPDYMSPEQAQASPVDGRTDIYSLGAVLFEMLSGRKPYVAGDPYAVALRHVTDPVPRLPETLAWLQPLIDQTMAKDREQRFATGDAFMAACDALLREHPIAPTSSQRRSGRRRVPGANAGDASGAPEITPQRSGQAPRWALPLAAAFVLAIAGTIAWRWLRPPAPPPGIAAPAAPPSTMPLPPPVEPAANSIDSAGLTRLDTPALLARAGKYVDDGFKSGLGEKFGYPAGDNAIDLFREVLKREPGNAAATQGLARIAAFYERGARSALDRGLNTGADELIEKGLRAAPTSEGLLKLKAELAAREKG
ncbi:MAG TPA: serine/threonine-protein kinase [Rudaea sp.]|nr:serine/threonine-protein kinase [Rudaea sp.]HSC11141.1 serine/threonine-protein kinase [Rhodanobacteraceae bacterium]